MATRFSPPAAACAAKTSRNFVSSISPVAPYRSANPYRNIAADIAPRKKYLTAASWALREGRLMATMMYVGSDVSSRARNSQIRSLALHTNITPMMLSMKNEKYSPRFTRMGSKRVRPADIDASRPRSIRPTLSIVRITPIAQTSIFTYLPSIGISSPAALMRCSLYSNGVMMNAPTRKTQTTNGSRSRNIFRRDRPITETTTTPTNSHISGIRNHSLSAIVGSLVPVGISLGHSQYHAIKLVDGRRVLG